MKLTVSEARARLGEVVLIAQDPNEAVILTRHGVAVAAVVSMANLQRIWDVEDEEERGEVASSLHKYPLRFGAPIGRLVRGLAGRLVTPKEAALQVRTLQKQRAEERRILEAGGLEIVEGGELCVESERVDRFRSARAEPRGRWAFWRRG